MQSSDLSRASWLTQAAWICQYKLCKIDGGIPSLFVSSVWYLLEFRQNKQSMRYSTTNISFNRAHGMSSFRHCTEIQYSYQDKWDTASPSVCLEDRQRCTCTKRIHRGQHQETWSKQHFQVLPSGNQACWGYMHAQLLDPVIPTRLKIHNALPIALHISLHAGLCPTYVDISIGSTCHGHVRRINSHNLSFLILPNAFASWYTILLMDTNNPFLMIISFHSSRFGKYCMHVPPHATSLEIQLMGYACFKWLKCPLIPCKKLKEWCEIYQYHVDVKEIIKVICILYPNW
jgi:hypothetical protein